MPAVCRPIWGFPLDAPCHTARLLVRLPRSAAASAPRLNGPPLPIRPPLPRSFPSHFPEVSWHVLPVGFSRFILYQFIQPISLRLAQIYLVFLWRHFPLTFFTFSSFLFYFFPSSSFM